MYGTHFFMRFDHDGTLNASTLSKRVAEEWLTGFRGSINHIINESDISANGFGSTLFDGGVVVCYQLNDCNALARCNHTPDVKPSGTQALETISEQEGFIVPKNWHGWHLMEAEFSYHPLIGLLKKTKGVVPLYHWYHVKDSQVTQWIETTNGCHKVDGNDSHLLLIIGLITQEDYQRRLWALQVESYLQSSVLGEHKDLVYALQNNQIFWDVARLADDPDLRQRAREIESLARLMVDAMAAINAAVGVHLDKQYRQEKLGCVQESAKRLQAL